mgnify:CR=1 FL=1
MLVFAMVAHEYAHAAVALSDAGAQPMVVLPAMPTQPRPMAQPSAASSAVRASVFAGENSSAARPPNTAASSTTPASTMIVTM